MTSLFYRACAALRRLATDRGGFSAVLTALMLTILIGFVGLGVDIGAWQWLQRDMQEAADHAVFAAAQSQVSLNATTTAASQSSTLTGFQKSTQVGLAVAVNGLGLNGVNFSQSTPNSAITCFTAPPANNNIEICVSYGPAGGNYNNNTWTVTISQPRPMWFSQILFSQSGYISARASAEPVANSGQPCIIALAGSGAGGLQVNGAGTSVILGTNIPPAQNIQAPALSQQAQNPTGCDALVYSTDPDALETGGTNTFSAANVYVGGGENLGGGGVFSPGLGASQNHENLGTPSYFFNPYTSLGSITPTGCDYTDGANHGPGVYCGTDFGQGWKSGTTIVLQPGLYVLWGVGLTLNNLGGSLAQSPGGSCPVGLSYTSGNCDQVYPGKEGKKGQGPTPPPYAIVASPYTTCSGGGVDATSGVTFYLAPPPPSGFYPAQPSPLITANSLASNTDGVQVSGSCLAINAPRPTQINSPVPSIPEPWQAPTNWSTKLSGGFNPNTIEGMAIWVANPSIASASDVINQSSNVAINGVFYDPNANRAVAISNSTVNGNCAQIAANQVVINQAANVTLQYCSYGNATYTEAYYLSSPGYDYLGPVLLSQ
jgi:Flp pilus assembly protein TadG